MNKKLAINLKPGAEKKADDWVRESVQTETVEKPVSTPAPIVMKRLTIDVEEELHRQLKMKAAEEGVRMADLVRQWIEENI